MPQDIVNAIQHGGLAGAAIAYVAWNKGTQVVYVARALELLNELESRGLKRYFDKSELSTVSL